MISYTFCVWQRGGPDDGCFALRDVPLLVLYVVRATMSRSVPSTDGTLAVYSDYVCPFCYLGTVAVEEYLDSLEDPPSVEWRFFDLRGYKRGADGTIDHEVDDGKDEEYFERVRENVERLGAKYDVDIALDFSRDIDSWNAQQSALHVRETHDEETFGAYHEALFEAMWTDGRDIGNPSVLADIAETVGIAPAEIRAAVDDEDLEAQLEATFEEARQAGIRSIPTFVYGEHSARGVIPPAQFERLVEGG